MSCWVVPQIAAEFWRVSVDHVWHQIREGKIASRNENGFTFVDVIPDSQPPSESKVEAETKVRMTYVPLTEGEESTSLLDNNEESEIEYEVGTIDWRAKRQKVQMLRKRPPLRAA